MRNRNANIILRGMSILLLSAAIVLTIISLIGYSRQRNNYPAGMTIGGVAVGGLTPAEASQRLLEVYTSPIEVQYGDAIIHVDPAVVGFQPDVESMLAAADLTRTGGSFWIGFWDYLWNRDPAPEAIPLRATISEERLREYLQNEIATRYDLPPTPAQPVPGWTSFLPGQPGQTLDVDRAVLLLSDALRSPTGRSVALSFNRGTAVRPTLENLEILLKQIVQVSGFDGLISLYMVDLQTGQEIHFAINNNEEISVEPDIAFTASSTIKVPIMVSYFINRGADIDEDTRTILQEIFQKSNNDATDALMSKLDASTGPVMVTQDMETIGLENTFIGGFFYLGAPNMLPGHVTPANSRVDVSTDPDPYSQTTASDIGTLLTDIYQCSQNGGGALAAAFPGKIDAAACKLMIDFMAEDKFGSLIQAGVPDGTLVAHKHGFVRDTLDNVHDISDAAIIYTPGGNYILTVYTYHPVNNIWETTNPLVIDLTEATYNYFNVPEQ
ncbi:MAG: serine hydrolase [Chloroflexi bacterium]|nr:serine hydrolase [Chloroflexota bacterium]